MGMISRTNKAPNRSARICLKVGEEVEVSDDKEVLIDCVHSFG